MIPPQTPTPGVADRLRRLARACLGTIPLGAWSRLAPKDLLALCYHLVSDVDLPHQLLYAYKTPRQFERDVELVASQAIGYDEASALRRGELRLPPHRFLVTFDDGFSQCFDVARPILRRHQVPAVFFINIEFMEGKRRFFESTVSSCLRTIAGLEPGRATELLARLGPDPSGSASPGRCRALERLGSARIRLPATESHLALALRVLAYEEDEEAALADAAGALGIEPQDDDGAPIFMSADQASRMAGEGFTLGSHGLTHLPMQRLDQARLERHIVESCAAIRDLSHQARVPFAFPYSGRGIDRSFLADLRRRNPFVDLLFDTQAFKRDAPFMVQRLAADLPPVPGDQRSNIPDLLRAAWSRRSAWYRDGAPPPERHGSHHT